MDKSKKKFESLLVSKILNLASSIKKEIHKERIIRMIDKLSRIKMGLKDEMEVKKKYKYFR